MRKSLLLFSILFCLFTTSYAQTNGELEAVGKDGKAEINIQLSAKSPEIVEKLKQLGFEVVNESETNLVGRVAVEKLAQLVEIDEVQLVLPIIE